MIMIKSYLTNAICPHCGKQLYTQDYAGEYPLYCKSCDEDMFFMENAKYTAKNPNPYFEVSIPMHIDVFKENKEKIIAMLPNISFLGFDDCNGKYGVCDIGWDNYEFLIKQSTKIMPKIRNVGRLKKSGGK